MLKDLSVSFYFFNLLLSIELQHQFNVCQGLSYISELIIRSSCFFATTQHFQKAQKASLCLDVRPTKLRCLVPTTLGDIFVTVWPALFLFLMPLLMTCDKKDDDKSIDQSIAAGDEIFISTPMKSYYDTSEKVKLNERGWICGINFDKFGLDLLVETNLKRFFVEMKIYCFKDLRNISLFSSQLNPERNQPRRNKNQSWVENQSTFCQMYANGTVATPIWSPSSSFRQWPKSNSKKCWNLPVFSFKPAAATGNDVGLFIWNSNFDSFRPRSAVEER